MAKKKTDRYGRPLRPSSSIIDRSSFMPGRAEEELQVGKLLHKALKNKSEDVNKIYNSLSPKQQRIADRLMKSLDRRDVKLGDWIANKDGLRSKKEWRKKREDERRGMGDRPVIKTTPLEKEKMRRLKGVGIKEQAAKIDEQERGGEWGLHGEASKEPPKEPDSTKKVAKVVPKRKTKKKSDTSKKKIDTYGTDDWRGFSGPVKSKVPPANKGKEKKGKDWKDELSLFGGGIRRKETIHTVKPRQTLAQIAKDGGTSLRAIQRANPGKFNTPESLNRIKVGQKINMPPNVGATTPYDAKTVRVKPKVVPTPKRKPTQKVSKEDQSVNLEDWSGGGELTVRPPLKPLEGGVRYKKLPDWLGGGEIKIDSSPEVFNKRGGQVKKGVKKTKVKARRRAALRGHRAELRGG